MELFQLRHFYTTAQYKNMTKAANELMVAQPALSKSIRNLEQELNAPLFIRSRKGMSLTTQGKILLKYCNHIFDAVESATREITESIHEKTKICLCLHSGSEMIGTTLSTFVKEHPNVSLEITEDDQHPYDILIDSASSSYIPEGANVLLSEEICLAVSDEHPLAKLTVAPLSALADEKLVVLSSSKSFQQILNQLIQAASIEPNISYSCNNNSLLQELVSMNMGISIAASINWAHSNCPANIRLIPFENHPCRLIYYKALSSFQSDALKDFEKTLVKHFHDL